MGPPPAQTEPSPFEAICLDRMQHIPKADLDIAPSPLMRVATMADAPWVSAVVGTDATEFMARVTTLVSDHGGFFLEPITSSVLEAHMFYLPEGRGKEALHAARAGLGYAFDMLGASVIFGRIPVEDRAARLFTRIIGFRSDGIRAREPGGPLVEWFEMRSAECPPQQQ